jgi:tetratricopeptide (TPR) repeat protein
MSGQGVDGGPCHVFISYRRDDSAGWTGRLASDLQERLGPQTVFQDVATIEAGEDFVAAITRVLQTCAVALVIIGPEWHEIRDEENGARRLENPQDLVRLETATALARPGLRVIPVLVGGARMPDADDLPADLRDLTKRNAFELSDTRWDYDVGKLAGILAKIAGLELIAGDKPRRPKALTATVAALLVAALGVALYLTVWRGRSGTSLRLAEFSIDRPSPEEVIPLGESQTWMLEGRLSFGSARQRAAPDIQVEVLKLPERRAIPQDGRLRLSTETGFWRFESARFAGAGPHEVIVTVRLGERSHFKSVEVRCLPKSDAFRRAIDEDRARRPATTTPPVGGGGRRPRPGDAAGAPAPTIVPPPPPAAGPAPEASVSPAARLASRKEQLYQLQQEFLTAYMTRRDLDEADRILTRTFNLIDPLLPTFPNDTELQNLAAYAWKNRAMVLRDRGNTRDATRSLAQAEQMFAAIREQNPEDAGAWNGLGSIAMLRNDPARALDYIDRALELRPDYAEARSDRAAALEMRRRQTGR